MYQWLDTSVLFAEKEMIVAKVFFVYTLTLIAYLATRSTAPLTRKRIFANKQNKAGKSLFFKSK